MRLRFELYMSSSFPPHCLQGLQQCCALEEAMLGVEQKIGIGPCFPVTVGRRPDKTHKCGAREDRAARNGPSAVGRYERAPLLGVRMWPVGCERIPLCGLVDAQSVNHLLITYSSLSPSLTPSLLLFISVASLSVHCQQSPSTVVGDSVQVSPTLAPYMATQGVLMYRLITVKNSTANQLVDLMPN